MAVAGGTAPAAAAEGQLVLLDFWVSPFGQRCRIALAEKKLPYEYSEQELLGAKSDLLLRSNPVHGMVPVLLHRAAVCESLVILEYLDDAFPDTPRLLPSAGDPYARARARFWADYVDKKVYPVGTRLWKLKGEEVRAAASAELVEGLRTLDAELGDKRFFGSGDGEGEAEFGFVDVALVPMMPWVYSFARYGEFSVEEECPQLVAWARRCMERESVAKSLCSPEEVYDFIGVLRKHYGIVD